MPAAVIPLDYVAEVLQESGERYYISEYIWKNSGGNCTYRKGEETYEEDAKKFVNEKFSKYNWWHNKHSDFWTFVDDTNKETFEFEWNKITIQVEINHFGYSLQRNGGTHHHAWELRTKGNKLSFVKLCKEECKQAKYASIVNPDVKRLPYDGILTTQGNIPLPITSTGFTSGHIVKRDPFDYIKVNELKEYLLEELGDPPEQGDLFS